MSHWGQYYTRPQARRVLFWRWCDIWFGRPRSRPLVGCTQILLSRFHPGCWVISFWMLILKLFIVLLTRHQSSTYRLLNWLVHWYSRERFLEHAVRKLHSSYRFLQTIRAASLTSSATFGALDNSLFAPQCFRFVFATSFHVWLTLTMLRFWSYSMQFYWFYICAFVENTFAFSWQFLRFYCNAISRAERAKKNSDHQLLHTWRNKEHNIAQFSLL